MITRKIVFTLIAIVLWAPVDYAADVALTPDGKVPGIPFQALQQQIDQLNTLIINLQTQVNNIQLIPGPKGDKGDTGATGPAGQSPVLTWFGDQIAINGAIGPHLTGPKGDQGDQGIQGVAGQAYSFSNAYVRYNSSYPWNYARCDNDDIAVSCSAACPHLDKPYLHRFHNYPFGYDASIDTVGLYEYNWAGICEAMCYSDPTLGDPDYQAPSRLEVLCVPRN